MRQLVTDMATGKQEWINFVAIESGRAFTAESYEYQLTMPEGYKDHTRPDYPMPATVLANIDEIHSVDASIPSEVPKSIFYDLDNNPCGLIPQGFRRNGQFCSDLLRVYQAQMKKGDELTAIRKLQSAHDRLTRCGYSFAMADDDIQRLADAKAHQFACDIRTVKGTQKQFDRVVVLLDSIGLAFRPELVESAKENNELFSLVNRAIDAKWLVRQLRRKCAYEVEQVARDMAIVQKTPLRQMNRNTFEEVSC